MIPVFYIIIIDCIIYSSLLLMKKYAAEKMSVETYLVGVIFCLFFLFLVYLLSNYKKITYVNRFNEIKKNFHILFLISFLQLSTAYLYFNILKYSELTYAAPLEFIFISFFAFLGGVMLFKETITTKKVIGIVTALITIYLFS